MSAEKTMSSRLLTMKFMQRAATTSSPSSPKTPKTPITPGDPPSKRQRLSLGSSNPRYSTIDQEAIKAAVAEEELKRSRAVERHAAELGETRWVLSVQKSVSVQSNPQFVVQTTGFADIDNDSEEDDDDSDNERLIGRMVIGKEVSKSFQRDSSTSDSDDQSQSDDESDEDGEEKEEDNLHAERRVEKDIVAVEEEEDDEDDVEEEEEEEYDPDDVTKLIDQSNLKQSQNEHNRKNRRMKRRGKQRQNAGAFKS